MVNLFNHDPLLQPRRLPTCDEYNSPNTPKLPFPNDPFHTYETYIIVIQYIVVKISTTIAAVVLELNNMYCPESMSPSFGHFWITLLNAFSVGLAMFTLFAFYLAVSSDLVAGARSIGSSAHPIAQFLSIKFVIFFGFWQGFIVKILVANGTLHGTDLWTAGEVSSAVQSFLVCLEMALASVLHNWAFSWRDFDNAADPDIGGGESMGVSMISNEPGHMGRSESMEQMLPAHYSSQYPPEEAFSSDEPHSRLSSSSIEHPHGSHRTSSPASSAAYLKEPRPPTPFWPAFQDSFNWFDLYYDFVEVVKFVLGRVWSIANKAFLLFCMCQMCRKRPELRLPDENDDVEDDDHLLFEN
ncbi:hypothetical protein HK098_005035 [Nowakowskiella sp. JEL0407]|nr:hypothetical protein HK098_005035 [Nowakowskiella sp. JEL0407]